eukprot:gene17594-19347_t
MAMTLALYSLLFVSGAASIHGLPVPGENELCFTKSFNYTVTLPGCRPVVINNNFCYGLCGSFSYPKSKKYGLKLKAVCSFCAPVKKELVTVNIPCHDNKQGNGTTYRQKIVTLFKDCKCKRTTCKTFQLQ